MKNVLLSVFCLFFAVNAFAAWTGSTSEPENMKKIDGKPFYVITNADELAWFAAQVNDGRTDINAVLANDIDFAEDGHLSNGWIPFNSFDGIIDGNGNEIKNISFSYDCFLKQLTTNGIVRNVSFRTNFAYSIIIENYGLITNVVNYVQTNRYAGIAEENYGKIINCENNGIVSGGGGIVRVNNGLVEYCRNNGSLSRTKGGVGGIVFENGENGIVRFCKNTAVLSKDTSKCYTVRSGMNSWRACDSYFNRDIAVKNGGIITNCIFTNHLIEENEGIIENSFGLTSYYLNNAVVSSTVENMQKDQFAWILNTSNGTEENSGVWSRGTSGYPTFANKDSLAIRKVVFDDDGTTTNRYTNYKGVVTFPENPEPAEGFIFKGWYNSDDVKIKPATVFTADQTVNAVYLEASDVYWIINFFNTDSKNTLLETKLYQHGSIVAYGGETPVRETTAQYAYTFKGWDVEPTNAVDDFDYYAVYDSTIRSYAITFNNYDGSKIESNSFNYGEIPSCSKIPMRNATAEWVYSHKGWNPALDYVTGEASYVATYDSSKVEYKVTFMNGIDIIDEQMVSYGDAAVAPTNVTRDGYKFTGWNTSFAKVTNNLIVKALFEELPKSSSSSVAKSSSSDAPKSSSSEKSSSSRGSSSSSKQLSSSSAVKSSSSARSSSSQSKSSSSGKTESIYVITTQQFSIQIISRSIQIFAAPVGSAYAILDLQGRVLKKGRVESANFNIAMSQAGGYLIRIGNRTQRIYVK